MTTHRVTSAQCSADATGRHGRRFLSCPRSGAVRQTSAAVSQATVAKENLPQLMKQQAMQSMDMSAPKFASEFYTDSEMASFNEVKKKVVNVSDLN